MPPTDTLLKLIEFANLAPLITTLPDFDKLCAEIAKSINEPEISQDQRKVLVLNEAFKKISKSSENHAGLLKKINKKLEYFGIDSDDSVLGGCRNYSLFCRTRQCLNYYAIEEKCSGELLFTYFVDLFFVPVVNGERFDIAETIVIPNLKGVDLDYLRLCLTCKKVFLATRKDKYGCSDKCNNIIRVNRNRLKNHRLKNGETFPSRVEKDIN